jgi:hypothetical protein
MQRLKGFITILFTVCLFVACDSEGGGDVIWDIAPVELSIFITDAEGNDLLDSTLQENLIKDITVSYQGEFELVFGEFNGEENIDKREITLNLPDSRQAILSYKNSFKWKSNGDPKKSTIFYLNGQELKDDAGKCGSYNFQYTSTQGLKYIPSEIK